MLLVGAVGLLLSVLVGWRAGDVTTLIKSVALLVTMMFLWLGVGNVLSVVSPLRDEPLGARRHDGTLVRFGLAFATSYVLGFGVNLMLYWRIWAKQTLIEQIGGIWLPVLLLVASAVAMWVLLTVLAVALTGQPRVRRELIREMVDHPAPKATSPADGAPVASGVPGR